MKNSNTKVNALESARYRIALVAQARELRQKEDLGSQLASALIYSSLVEAVVDSMFLWLALETWKSKELKVGINLEYYSQRGANLGGLIKELNMFTFPRREVILDLLNKIKSARNNIFHRLATAPEAGMDVLKEVKSLQSESEKFMIEWGKFTDIIDPEIPD